MSTGSGNLREHDVSRVGAHGASPKRGIRSTATVSTSDRAMAGTATKRPGPTGPGLLMIRQPHGPAVPSWGPPWDSGSVSCSRWSSRSSSTRSRSRPAAWRCRTGSSRARPAARPGPAARPPPERPGRRSGRDRRGAPVHHHGDGRVDRLRLDDAGRRRGRLLDAGQGGLHALGRRQDAELGPLVEATGSRSGQPAEDVVHQAGGDAQVGSSVMPAGSKRMLV